MLFETPFHCEPAPLILNFFTEHSCLYLIFTKTRLFLEDTAFPVQLLNEGSIVLSYSTHLREAGGGQYPLLTKLYFRGLGQSLGYSTMSFSILPHFFYLPSSSYLTALYHRLLPQSSSPPLVLPSSWVTSMLGRSAIQYHGLIVYLTSPLAILI